MIWDTVDVEAAYEETTHRVQIGDDGFTCMTCSAHDFGDGYLLSQDGAQEWHDRLGQ